MAFYYGGFETGARIPWQLAERFARLVVEPEHDVNPHSLAARGTQPIAYLSVGEISPHSRMRPVLDAFAVGENANWGSMVLDIHQRGYQDYLVERMAELIDRGYTGVFLDTLDSYRLVTQDPARLAESRQVLVKLIQRMAKKRPSAAIWINRGFELLPDIASAIAGISAESLYDRFVSEDGTYERVPVQDRDWLLDRLREVQRAYQLPIVVIDYRPPDERDEAMLTAERIAKLGFTPYVTDGSLQTAGVGPPQRDPAERQPGEMGNKAEVTTEADAADDDKGETSAKHDQDAGVD